MLDPVCTLLTCVHLYYRPHPVLLLLISDPTHSVFFKPVSTPTSSRFFLLFPDHAMKLTLFSEWPDPYFIFLTRAHPYSRPLRPLLRRLPLRRDDPGSPPPMPRLQEGVQVTRTAQESQGGWDFEFFCKELFLRMLVVKMFNLYVILCLFRLSV